MTLKKMGTWKKSKRSDEKKVKFIEKHKRIQRTKKSLKIIQTRISQNRNLTKRIINKKFEPEKKILPKNKKKQKRSDKR